jgi:hypothetical protein
MNCSPKRGTKIRFQREITVSAYLEGIKQWCVSGAGKGKKGIEEVIERSQLSKKLVL